MFQLREARRRRRPIALPTALCFLWTFILSPAVLAAAHRPARPAGHTRKLTPAEMRQITGAQTEGYPSLYPTSPDSGESQPWQGSYGGVQTGTGNRAIRVPLFGWAARGGLPVEFSLYYNSKSTVNGALGQKWTCSYQIDLAVADTSGDVTVHWANDQTYTFARNVDGSYTAPSGIHETLVYHSSPASYDLTTHDQVKYHFTIPNSAHWLCTGISDPNANTLTLAYDAGDRLTSVTDPTSRAISLGYTSGALTSVTDPQSRAWSLSYSGMALQQVSWPTLNSTTYTEQFAYDEDLNHLLVQYTDRRGKQWTYGYDGYNRASWARDPYDNETGFTYPSATEVDISDPNGNVTEHHYDGSGRLTSVVDALANTESYEYDSDNNRIEVTDRRGELWEYEFDSSGKVTSATDPLSHETVYTWNSKNRLLTVTDPLGHQVVNAYDSTLNWRLTQVQEKDASSNVLSTTAFTYNSDGTVDTKTDDNDNETEYGYDSDGNLTSVTTPLGNVSGFGYNDLGVRTSREDALERETTYTLDAWNRHTGTTYPNSSTRSFSFDPNGNLTGWTDGAGTWSRTYDDANRLTAEALNSTTRFSYAYDDTNQAGLLSSMADSASRTFTYAYTDRNELASVTEADGMANLTTSYTYDENGNETGITNPNSTTVTKGYDDANRLTSITNKNSSNATLSSFSYGYNNDNLRTSCTEADSTSVSYGYSAAHRLTSESRSGTNSFSVTYSVDGVGNRTSQTVGSTTTSFTLNDDDELTATSGGFGNSYSYNDNGEQTGRTLGSTSYSLAYDYDGQLTSITQGSSTTSFGYDGLGRRLSRTVGSTTTQFLSSGNQVYLEAQGSTVTAKYGYGNALVHKDGEYPLFDGLGSERTVTNSSQSVTGTINFEAFGQTVGTTGSSSNPYMFAATSGYRTDGDAGLMHVGARYYDAQVGRFITRDTVLTEEPYLYCEHDPVNGIDPSGHNTLVIGAGVGHPKGQEHNRTEKGNPLPPGRRSGR